MSAHPHRRRGVSQTEIAIGILLVLMALTLALPGRASTFGLLIYFVFVVITIFVVRGVRQEPGSWMGRRFIRRGVVVTLCAVCIGILATPRPIYSETNPVPGTGAYVGLVMFMLLLNVLLGGATQRVAGAPESSVDERQEALRNRAHRIAYPVLVVLVGGTLAVSDLATSQSRVWLDATLSWGGWIVFLELLFVLPAMVLAFIEPDRVRPEPGETLTAPGNRGRFAVVLLVVAFAIPIALSVLLALVPPSTTNASSGSMVATTTSATGNQPLVKTCRYFLANVQVGRGIQTEFSINAVACWNGARATESYGLGTPDCHPGDSVAVSVSTLACTSTTAPDGTFTFAYRALVSSSVIPFLDRTVSVEVVIDKNGHVLDFP